MPLRPRRGGRPRRWLLGLGPDLIGRVLEDLEQAPGDGVTATTAGCGLYWEVGLWVVLQLTPGDPATAARVGLLRGVHALRAAVRAADPSPDKPAPLDVKQWWDDWQAAFAADLPPAAAPPRRPLDDLLRLADCVPDTEFLARLDALAGAGGR